MLEADDGDPAPGGQEQGQDDGQEQVYDRGQKTLVENVPSTGAKCTLLKKKNQVE